MARIVSQERLTPGMVSGAYESESSIDKLKKMTKPNPKDIMGSTTCASSSEKILQSTKKPEN